MRMLAASMALPDAAAVPAAVESTAMATQPEPEPQEADAVSPFTGSLTPELAADTAWCTAHAAQLRSIGLPPPLAAALAAKLRLQLYDVGESIGFGWTDGFDTARDSWFVTATRDIPSESDVWLSDHVWLVPNAVEARTQLASTPELAARLWMLLGTAEEGVPPPDADALLALVAPLAHPIMFATADGDPQGSQMHYIADEFGSRITLVPVGGGEPNVKFAAIYDEQSQRTYSLVWPCADIAEGDLFQRLATPTLELIAEGGQEYWERRFDAEESFDWYCGWDAIENVVLDAIARTGACSGERTVLVAGNGNSPLPVQLEQAARAKKTAESGPAASLRVLAVDYVASVVERMQLKYPAGQTSVEWLVGDLTDWSSFNGAEMAVDVIVSSHLLPERF